MAAEAMACGTPLLLTDCRFGARDIVEPGVTGELVPVNVEAALATEIAALLASPERRSALARAGREKVERFRLERMLEAYAALFDEQFAARRR